MGRDSLRIALLAGHHGPGSGAAHDGLDEWSLACRAVCAIGAAVANCGHLPIPITTDGRHHLEKRVELVKLWKADLVIACHFNAHENTSARGVEVLYWPIDGPSHRLAECMVQRVSDACGFENRGARARGRLYVLGELHCPRVILEAGFLSCPGDRALIRQSFFFDELAGAVALAVQEWRVM